MPEWTGDVRFGSFLLLQRGEALYRDGALVKLGSRARHILSILVSRAGDMVSKRELMDSVWPTTTVVEANLTVHIAALRQALGESRTGAQYIVNVPGRGYRFIGEVELIAEAPGHDGDLHYRSNLPLRLTSAIGREVAMREVEGRLAEANMVTITGPAGVGKTTLALSLGEARVPRLRDGVWFVDLTPIQDAENVPAAVAAVMQLELSPGDPVKALAAALRDREAFFIIDNCEHLIDAAASMIVAICSACPRVSILATSREPLNLSGETVYRLQPLEFPPPSMLIGASEALAYPAVQLLAERAGAAASEFELNDQNALSAALICRRLDGIPLAIEFAAALVGTFGLAGMAGRLDEHLRLLGVDRRGGTARHRTLEAALDWSYKLLDEGERIVLRRLSIFAGGFSMEAAQEVVPGPGEALDVGTILAGLTLKSLIASDITGPDLRFHMLETTRAFALGRLEDARERGLLADRHARHYRDYLLRQHETLEQRDIAADAAELDNIRAALRHALGPDGDIDVALGLASGALPVWFGLSLLQECHARLKELTPRLSPAQRATNEGWNVAVASRTAEMFTRGTARATVSAWDRPPEDRQTWANSLPSVADLLTNWTWNLRLPNYAEMMRLATQHAAIARRSGTLHDRTMSAWVLGLSSHHIGDPVAARGHLAHFLAIESIEDRRIFVSHTGFDRTPGAQAMLAASLCQLGDMAEGLRQADLAEAAGRATGRSLPLCEAMMWVHAARLIAREHSPAIETSLEDLAQTASDHSLDSHHGVLTGLLGVCLARRGEYAGAEPLLARAIATLGASNYGPFTPWFTGVLARSVARQGRHVDARAILTRFHEADINGDAWCTPELLRLEALTGEAASEKLPVLFDMLGRAIELARSQAALGWEAMIEISRSRMLDRAKQPGEPERLNAMLERLSGRGFGALSSGVAAELARITG